MLSSARNYSVSAVQKRTKGDFICFLLPRLAQALKGSNIILGMTCDGVYDTEMKITTRKCN